MRSRRLPKRPEPFFPPRACQARLAGLLPSTAPRLTAVSRLAATTGSRRAFFVRDCGRYARDTGELYSSCLQQVKTHGNTLFRLVCRQQIAKMRYQYKS